MFINKNIFNSVFHYRGKYWYKNIKQIPRYFKEISFLLQHGYEMYAEYETFQWFIDVFSKILKNFRKNHISFPVLLNDVPYDSECNNQKWNEILDNMIKNICLMDEDNEAYTNMNCTDIFECQNQAKQMFMFLFSEYFYHLWD